MFHSVLNGPVDESLVPFARFFEVSIVKIFPINVTESKSDGETFTEFIIISKSPCKVSSHVDTLLLDDLAEKT